MEPQNYCLKWKKQIEHFQNTFVKYIDHQLQCDVTIASDGEVLKAHQFVLSACSSYFENIFSTVPNNQHPIIFLKDITSLELKALINYMYKGQAVVSSDLLPGFLKTCKYLKIQGLCEESYGNTQTSKRKHNQVLSVSNDITDSDSEPKSQRNRRLPFANKRSQKKKRKKVIGDTSEKLPTPQTNSETCSELNQTETQTNKNQTHEQTIREILVSQEPQQQNEINENTISKKADHKKLFFSKLEHLQENVHVPTTNSTQDVNQSVNNEIIQSSILDSPVYNTQTSFIFDVDNVDPSKPSDHQFLHSSQSLIINDVVPEVVEISDDEICDTNVEMLEILELSQDRIEHSAVQLDAETQTGISKDVDLNKVQESESDDSEIKSFSYFRRNRVQTDINLSNDDSSNFSKDTEPNEETDPNQEAGINTENGKNEALRRAQSMKIILAKESYVHFIKNLPGHGTKNTSSTGSSNIYLTANSAKKQNETPPTTSRDEDNQPLADVQASISKLVVKENVQSGSNCEKQNQWLKSFNLVKKKIVKEAKEKKMPKRQLRPRTPKATKKGS